MTYEEKRDKAISALDHPCKQTCSGWKQGHERGMEDAFRKVCQMLNTKSGKVVLSLYCPANVVQWLNDNKDEILTNKGE